MSGTWIPLPASAASRSSFESGRSEEHTSELQSRSDLVCRLLLEKKKRHIRPGLQTRDKGRYRRVTTREGAIMRTRGDRSKLKTARRVHEDGVVSHSRLADCGER